VPLSNAQLADKLQDVADGWQTFVNQFRAWLTTPFNGGANSDGMVPATDQLNFTDDIPSLDKLKYIMNRGYSAANDIVFDFSGGVVSVNELLATYTHAGEATSIDVAQSVGTRDAGLASNVVLSITKNGSAWGTVTFTTAGAVTFSIADPSLAHGDVLRVFGPATYVASFLNPSFTLAGSIS
jgi:hypothetical protein